MNPLHRHFTHPPAFFSGKIGMWGLFARLFYNVNILVEWLIHN